MRLNSGHTGDLKNKREAAVEEMLPDFSGCGRIESSIAMQRLVASMEQVEAKGSGCEILMVSVFVILAAINQNQQRSRHFRKCTTRCYDFVLRKDERLMSWL